ncbi:MAG: lysophospholipid acyltransferase family protein [Candidatus Moranbacteria bacterium]|nr:lysophospholipid acyltransferase family protein [Candidatus Moranbacteria bacterium]MDX9856151.1 lysophospholipid acyltransferase family protein [Candidatus Moranbacteria bacterium]
MLYYIAWLLLQPCKLLMIVEGLENIPKTKIKMLVIASHNGKLDPWRIGIHFPFRLAIYWFGRKEFFNIREAAKEFNWLAAPFVALVVRFSLTIPVNRDENDPINIAAIKKAIRLLKQEDLVGVFPRAKTGEREYVNANFVRLALKTEAWILPVNVDGRRVVFGPAFQIEKCGKDEHLKIAQEIMKKIEAM